MREPQGGAHRAPSIAMAEVWRVIRRHMDELTPIPGPELARSRREKFRRIGAIEGRFPTI